GIVRCVLHRSVVRRVMRPFLALLLRPPPPATLFPYTTLFRSPEHSLGGFTGHHPPTRAHRGVIAYPCGDRVRGGFLRQQLGDDRSEEHTSELQSREKLVCRLLLEKKIRNGPYASCLIDTFGGP